MNHIIKRELQKVKIAKIPEFDENTLKLVIPQNNKISQQQSSNVQLTLEVNKCYNITVENYIINPPPGFTLKENWNRNISIDDKNLNILVSAINGQMIKFDGNGLDTSKQYHDMWLPRKSITINKII